MAVGPRTAPRPGTSPLTSLCRGANRSATFTDLGPEVNRTTGVVGLRVAAGDLR